jgi:hypothetical protein
MGRSARANLKSNTTSHMNVAPATPLRGGVVSTLQILGHSSEAQ